MSKNVKLLGGMDPAVWNELPPELLAEIESTMPLCERVKMNKRKRSTINEKPKYAEESSDDDFDPNGESKSKFTQLTCVLVLELSLFDIYCLWGLITLFFNSRRCKKETASRQRQGLGIWRKGAPWLRGTQEKWAAGQSSRLRKSIQRFIRGGFSTTTTQHDWRFILTTYTLVFNMLFHMHFFWNVFHWYSSVWLGLGFSYFFGTFTLETGIFAINIKQLCLKRIAECKNTQNIFFMQLQENWRWRKSRRNGKCMNLNWPRKSWWTLPRLRGSWPASTTYWKI